MAKLLSTRFNLVFFFIVTVVSLDYKSEAADEFRGCDPDDEDVDECLKRLLEIALSETTKSHEEYGVPVFDPLTPTRWNLTHDKAPNIIELAVLNTKHFGLSKATVPFFKSDLKNYIFNVDLLFTKYQVEGDYIANGLFTPKEKSQNVSKGKYNNVLGRIPIVGEGKLLFKMFDMVAHYTANGTTYEKNGNEYLKLDIVKTMDPFLIYSQYDNLFNGTEELGKITNQNINSNWKDFYEPLYPSIEKLYAAEVTDAANRLFSQVPLKAILRKSK